MSCNDDLETRVDSVAAVFSPKKKGSLKIGDYKSVEVISPVKKSPGSGNNIDGGDIPEEFDN